MGFTTQILERSLEHQDSDDGIANPINAIALPLQVFISSDRTPVTSVYIERSHFRYKC
ncbi:hypothetical protein [Rivularia sp. UHCC 0363]|uniref:hypothetical protein n=1 Tax=Rivularia sp. UHCC 0363 TaxID=3110244 RepID=UPI002B215D8C|nr:hypothetical protein [Rivularia sp. UHCC 0363]MEA5593437.1 hypothetical protein [Rivularia sp. UHCC 0363]